MWATGHNGDLRRAAHGYEPTREAAMAVFKKSWRRGQDSPTLARWPSCCRNVGRTKSLEESDGRKHMSRSTGLFFEIIALLAIATPAEAADGCGRGWYYNGRRCVPQDGPGSGSPYHRGYGPPVDRGPQFRLDLGGGRDEARYSPPNPRFRTWNNCPTNYTVQDGLCKPYRGR